jgi:hypothetical protein
MQTELVEIEGEKRFVVGEEDGFSITRPEYWAARQIAVLGSWQDEGLIFFGEDDREPFAAVCRLVECQHPARVGRPGKRGWSCLQAVRSTDGGEIQVHDGH